MSSTPPRSPIDVPTRETVDFLRAHLPPGASLLEIGCGPGDVALAMTRMGYQVHGVDPDADAVATARDRGVVVSQASWPETPLEPFPVDAVAFTRSLHHVSQLEASVREAARWLRPGGQVLVEDFAFTTPPPIWRRPLPGTCGWTR